MRQSFDPDRLEAMARSLAKQDEALQSQHLLLKNKINQAVSAASGYHEDYVRSAVAQIRDTEQRINKLSSAISLELRTKAKEARSAVEGYRAAEAEILRTIASGSAFPLGGPVGYQVSKQASLGASILDKGADIAGANREWVKITNRYKYLTPDKVSVVNPRQLVTSKANARVKGYSALEKTKYFSGIRPGATGMELVGVSHGAGVAAIKTSFKGMPLAKNAALAGVGIAVDTYEDVQYLKAKGADEHTLGAAVVTNVVFGTAISAISIGASAYSAAFVGAAIGSSVPIVGTVIGAAVGLVVGYWMSKELENGLSGVKETTRDALAQTARENADQQPYYLYRDR